LGDVRCPVLVVVGDLDLSSLQARCRELAALIPDAELHVMEGAGHLPALEQPEKLVGILREFLNRALHP
jgi:pimeloyl-ACP methyl ester carboxylesterase